MKLVLNCRSIAVSLLVVSFAAEIHAQTNTFPSSGNVGVGTTSPSAKLYVLMPDGAGGPEGALARSNLHLGNAGYAGDLSQITLGYPGATYAPSAIGHIATVSTGYTYGDLYFATRNVDTDTAPTERMRITSSGNVGIGTTSPILKLDVLDSTSTDRVATLRRGYQGPDSSMAGTFGTPYLAIGGAEYWGYSIQSIGFGYSVNGSYQPAEIGFLTLNEAGETSGAIVFANRKGTDDTIPSEVMRITSAGDVGIGTTSPTYPLSVNGTVEAKEVIVQTGWSDYVFDKSYHVPPLSEIKRIIKTQRHLPGMPSAQEVATHGISLGNMEAKLLAQIEQLTLRQIDQEEKIQALEAQNLTLNREVAVLKESFKP